MDSNEGKTAQDEIPSRPQTSLKTATALVEKLYKLRVTEITELVSYDDRNYKVTVDLDSCESPHISDVSPHGYNLKILNRKDTPIRHAEAEHAMMKLLRSQGINTITPVINVYGEEYSIERLLVETDDNANADANELASGEYLVRLLTFVPGRTLHSVPYTPRLFYESGVMLGRMTAALQGFSHPLLNNFEIVWSLKNLSDLREYVYAVQEPNHKKLVLEVVEAFEKEIVPNYSKLRKSVLHGDVNDQNLIVTELPANQQTATDSYTLSGIIDYGDMQAAYSVMDLAILIMYVMTDCESMDPRDVGGHVCAGYKRHFELTDAEFESLHVLVSGRFAQSLTLGAYTFSQDPTNEYLLLTAVRGWKVLDSIWNTPKHELYSRWKATMAAYE